MKTAICAFLSLSLAVVLLASCSFSKSYFVVGGHVQRQELTQMLAGVDDGHTSYETRFVYVQQITAALRAHGDANRLNLFLTDYVRRHPKDPYDAYYLYVVAQDYDGVGAFPFAAAYYDRIVADYPDLMVRGKSLHYLCLMRLIKITKDPQARVGYYKDLIARYGDKIQMGPTYYSLGETYGELHEWDLELQAFKSYLSYPDVPIPGHPEARNEVTYFVNFYEYPKKNWAMPSLSDLVTAIRSAIANQNVSLLLHYQAKVGFFVRSWESGDTPTPDDPEFLTDFGVFMNPSVWVSDTLDANSQEAYLRTGGWTYRIETWYLYFRRINFPADPNVQGQWEWAGIYFGDKPFSGPQSNH